MPEQDLTDLTDPWKDENVQLDTAEGPKHLADLTEPESTPEPALGELEPPAEVPAPEAIPEPVVFNYEDGSRAVVEKSNKGWKATLDSGTGAQPEVFYGATKEKMYERLMSAKIQATKKIREQNRSIKLGINQPQSQPEYSAPVEGKNLTPDEVNQLKLQLADNPDLALDSYFRKKTGLSLEELTRMAEEGRRAQQNLAAESISQAFVENTPEYYPTPKNYQAVVKWIARYKLNEIANEQNFGPILYKIYDRNLWTLATITEAFDDLRENDLLDVPPLTPAPAVTDETGEEAEEVAPTPAPTRRPRPAAGLGIRQNEARGANRPIIDLPVTPDNLDNLSDKEIEDLMQQVRRQPRDLIKASLEKSRQR